MSRLDHAYTLRWRSPLRVNHGGDDQILRFQLLHFTRRISRSPFAGLSYDILHEEINPSSPPASATTTSFPLPLRELEDPSFCEAYVVQLLSSSFNFDSKNSTVVAREIAALVADMAAGNYDAKFELVAEVDYIKMSWRRSSSGGGGGGGCVMVEERVVLEEARRWREELGECCVCCEELKGPGKEEVARIPCGHVYHKTCILTWLQMNNSCPLCRSKIRDI